MYVIYVSMYRYRDIYTNTYIAYICMYIYMHMHIFKICGSIGSFFFNKVFISNYEIKYINTLMKKIGKQIKM